MLSIPIHRVKEGKQDTHHSISQPRGHLASSRDDLNKQLWDKKTHADVGRASKLQTERPGLELETIFL